MNYDWGKKVLIFFSIFFFSIFLSQTKRHVLIDNKTQQKFEKKDSALAVKFLDSLVRHGYYFTEVKSIEEKDNGIYIHFDKKQEYRRVEVEISDSLALMFKHKKRFFTSNIDSLKTAWNHSFAQKGYTFNRIKTIFKGIKNDIPQVEISVFMGEQRKINKFEVRGYEKIPDRFLKNLSRGFMGTPYTEKVLLAIQRELQNHSFVTLERSPQTLFSRDSTQVFLFLQKRKVNIFDAIVGFANDKTEKLSFSGTLNLQLKNILNSFESMGIYWQRTPEKSQTFNFNSNFPYILGSNIGVDIQMNIHRQQEDFANVLFSPTLFYNISNRQKIGVKGSLELSTTERENQYEVKNYTKRGIGVAYTYIRPTLVEIFGHASSLVLEGQYFQNLYQEEDLSARQYKFLGKVEHNFQIKGDHWLNVKIEGGILQSNLPMTSNEAFRFGGWNSFRGFNENVLLAHSYYFGGTEYRYLIGNQVFFDVFGQYGQMYHQVLNLRPQLYSIGVGFHFYLPVGLMSFQISNGTTSGQPMRFSDTKIHWGIVSRF